MFDHDVRDGDGPLETREREPSVSGASREIQGRLQRYLKDQVKTVEGWLPTDSGFVIARLAECQSERGLSGGVGEIGVHHGKLFLLLYLSMLPHERAFAVDLFDDQQSVDGIYFGGKSVFLKNVARYGGTSSRLIVIARNSLEIVPRDLLDATGPVRLMSVDGGHSEDVTCNDLRLAEEVLLPEGILIVDDVYNQYYPAVASGFFRFLMEPQHRLRPFAMSPNKTFLCKDPDAAAFYRNALTQDFSASLMGTHKIFGSDVPLIGPSSVANSVRNLPFVRHNRKLYRMLAYVRNRLRRYS